MKDGYYFWNSFGKKNSLLVLERVLSLLSTLTAQQDSALEDYIEALVMRRYNDCQRRV